MQPGKEESDLAPGWVTETVVIWTQFPARKGILDLSDRGLAEIPVEVYRMRKLETLIFVNNKLTAVPSELSKLADAGLLSKLDFSSNHIEHVSPELKLIHSLEIVKLGNNKLSTFPPCIPNLLNLTEIDVSNNQISCLPNSIGSMIFLEKLYIQDNYIESLPNAITSLGGLKHLNFSNNKVSCLPKNFDELRRLTELSMENNLLEELPDELGFLLSLNSIRITGNPFSTQPEINDKQIYERGKLFKYLRNKIRKKKHLRFRLFTEKDNTRNTRFESHTEDTKPTLTAATPEKLALFLTQVAIPDLPTLACVETCYPYFTTPLELLELFFLRYEMNKKVNTTNKEAKKVAQVVQSRIIFVIITLLKKFNHDQVVYDEETTLKLKHLIEEERGVDSKHIFGILTRNESVNFSLFGANESEIEKERKKQLSKEAAEKKKLDEDLRRQFTKEKKKFIKQQKKHHKTNGSGRSPATSSDDRHILSFNANEIAMELCLLDSEKFSVIPRNEFLQQKWAKSNPEEKAPKITLCISNFNKLYNWIVSFILKQTDMKTRVRTIHHILDVASELFILGDYSALFAFGSAFSCGAISRLKETFSLLDEKRNDVLDSLNTLTAGVGNYKRYKELLAISIENGFAVPHLAIDLKNLTFTEEGNPTYVDESDVINFSKFRFITNLVDDVEKMQKKGYQYILDEQEEIRKLLLSPAYQLEEKEQYEWSLKCEASKRQAPKVEPVVLPEPAPEPVPETTPVPAPEPVSETTPVPIPKPTPDLVVSEPCPSDPPNSSIPKLTASTSSICLRPHISEGSSTLETIALGVSDLDSRCIPPIGIDTLENETDEERISRSLTRKDRSPSRSKSPRLRNFRRHVKGKGFGSRKRMSTAPTCPSLSPIRSLSDNSPIPPPLPSVREIKDVLASPERFQEEGSSMEEKNGESGPLKPLENVEQVEPMKAIAEVKRLEECIDEQEDSSSRVKVEEESLSNEFDDLDLDYLQ